MLRAFIKHSFERSARLLHAIPLRGKGCNELRTLAVVVSMYKRLLNHAAYLRLRTRFEQSPPGALFKYLRCSSAIGSGHGAAPYQSLYRDHSEGLAACGHKEQVHSIEEHAGLVEKWMHVHCISKTKAVDLSLNFMRV